MSLLDTFRPKWQNSNPDKRIEAVEELETQDTLERIAITDEDSDVRTAAVRKLNQIPVLLQISKNDSEASIRRLAENRYFEEVAKMLNIHPQTVSLYAKRGFIRKICCGTIGKRASRYSAQSISALLAGDKERI